MFFRDEIIIFIGSKYPKYCLVLQTKSLLATRGYVLAEISVRSPRKSIYFLYLFLKTWIKVSNQQKKTKTEALLATLAMFVYLSCFCSDSRAWEPLLVWSECKHQWGIDVEYVCDLSIDRPTLLTHCFCCML